MEISTTSKHTWTNTTANKTWELQNSNSHTLTNGCLTSKSINISQTTYGKPQAYLMHKLRKHRIWETTKTYVQNICSPKERLMATNISQSQLHTLLETSNWQVTTRTLHLHPPTHKRSSHSPTQQSSTPNNPHTPIQQTYKVLYPSKCRQPTQLAPRHHHYGLVNTMHTHGLAKTQHIMSTRGPYR